MANTGFKSYTTPDGLWNYGYAEYNKKLTDASGISPYAVSESVFKSLPSPLDTLYKKFLQATVAATVAANEPALVPTYYIWAKAVGKDVKLRLAGEWYFDAAKRDSYFTMFESQFAASNLSDALRVVIISQFAALRDPYSLSALVAAAKASGLSSITKAENYHPPIASATPFVIATVAGIGLSVYLLTRRR